jgi:hypothetical protein
MGSASAIRLSVWELSEFVFCPRAGLIARRMTFDGEARFQEDDDSYGRLDFLPDYDGVVIERAITETIRKINIAVIAVCVTLIVAYVLHLFVWWGSLAIGIALVAPWIFWLVKMIRHLRSLTDYAKLFRDRAPNEPPLDLDRPTEFNWWDFHKAGFQVVKPRDYYHDPELNLAGCPWRILVRGSLRIPVFRKHGGAAQAGHSQFATTAAYSHLLRVCEGMESPYGVILFPDSWTVLVIPDRCGSDLFRSALGRFRDMLDADDRGQSPEPPSSTSPCKGCPHGQPRWLVTDAEAIWEPDRSHWTGQEEPVDERPPSIHVLGGESIRPFPVYGVDWRRYHSLCGDLYRWIPPHSTANRLGLQLTAYPDATAEDQAVSPPVPPPVYVTVNNLIAPYSPSAMPSDIHSVAQSVDAATIPHSLPNPVSPPGVKTTPPPAPSVRPKPNDEEEEFGAGIE